MEDIKNSVKQYDISGLVRPLDSVVRGQPDAALGSALSEVRSSHDAVFVFDDREEFLGLASPYGALYASYFPYTAKLSSILFRPPAITTDTPLYEVAEHMLSTKLYTLPVFGAADELIGVVSSKDILQHVTSDPDLLRSLSERIELRQPVTASVSATVDEIYQLLKEKGVSRVLLLEDAGGLSGIVSRSDLMQAFMKPTQKRRFPPEGAFSGFHSRAGEKKFREDFPARTYAVGLVDTLSDKSTTIDIVKRLVSSPHSSIVMVDRKQKPTGFLSVRDLLRAVSSSRPEADIPLSMKKPDSVSVAELATAEKYLIEFSKKLKKRVALEKIDVTSEEIKNTKGITRQYDTTLIVVPVAGTQLVASAKERAFLDSVQEAAAMIEKQRKRTGLHFHETK